MKENARKTAAQVPVTVTILPQKENGRTGGARNEMERGGGRGTEREGEGEGKQDDYEGLEDDYMVR